MATTTPVQTEADKAALAKVEAAKQPIEKVAKGSTVKRVPVYSITVFRDGKPVVPKAGEVYTFTKEEYDQIMKANPKALRKPIVEVEAADDDI